MAPTPDPTHSSVGGGAKKDEASVKVPSKDPKKKDDKKDDDLVSSVGTSPKGFNFNESVGSAVSY